MPDIPQRVSLLAQVVATLRRGITNRRWQEFLPPERELCVHLEISRSTLRRAIQKIEAEGLIDAGHSGTRRRITANTEEIAPKPVSTGTKNIVWLTRLPLSEMPSVNLRLIALLQERLSSHGCMLNVVRVPEKLLAHPKPHMQAWLDEHPADVRILHWMPEPVQQWFYQHEPVACIFGSPAPGIELASIEIDSLAPLRHAVAMLQRQGHRRIGLVREDRQLVGEQRLEDLFRQLSGKGLSPSVIACPMEPTQISGKFEKMFTRKDVGLPTALICTLPHLALSSLTWLQRNGVTVPDQISLILLRSQPLLAYANPTLAHYAIHEERTIPQLIPRLLDLLTAQTTSTTPITLVPEFVPGESMKS